MKRKKNYVIINDYLIIDYFLENPDEHIFAKSFFEHDVFDGYTTCYIPQIVLFKSIYILENIYKIERAKIAEAIIYLLNFKDVITPDKEIIKKALEFYGQDLYENLDLIDCYLLAFAKNKNEVYFGDTYQKLAPFLKKK